MRIPVFLPIPNSSGSKLFGMGIMQVDSRLNSEQIDNLFISVGGQKGVGGGGEAQNLTEAQKLHVSIRKLIFIGVL